MVNIDLDSATAEALAKLSAGSAADALICLGRTAAAGLDTESWQRLWLLAAGLQPQSAELGGAWLHAERNRLAISRDRLAAELGVRRYDVQKLEQTGKELPIAWLPTLRRLGFESPIATVDPYDQERFRTLFSVATRLAAMSPLNTVAADSKKRACRFCGACADAPPSGDPREFLHADHCLWVDAQRLQLH